MKNPDAQTKRIITAILVLPSLFISLTPRIPAHPLSLDAPAKTQAQSHKEPASEPSEDSAKLRAREAYGNLPLSFEPNQGQSDDRVKFLSRGQGYTLFLTATEAVLALRDETQPTSPSKANQQKTAKSGTKSAVLRMKLVGAQSDARIEGHDSLQGKVNYLIGNNQSKWHTDVPTYRQVRYQQVWPGIDMVWHGKQGELEYDFIVKPRTDASQIRLGFEGADKLQLDAAGNLLVLTKAGQVVQRPPVIYQDDEHGRQTISGKYVRKGKRDVGFEVGAYDASKPLVIDPQLIYSTYLGGSSFDEANSIAVDNSGNAYIAGRTSSANFPITNVVDPDANPLLTAAFVTKLNAAGTDTLYSTIIGAGSGFVIAGEFTGTHAKGIAVTGDGKAGITGFVDNSSNESGFPLTPNAYQKNGFCLSLCSFAPDRAVDAFVTVLNSQGNGLFYSTFFGGSSSLAFNTGRAVDVGEAIAVDSANRIYITGSTASNNLPTKNAFQPSRQSSSDGTDAFVAVFNPAAAHDNDTLLYSSFLGGSGDDIGRGVAVDSSQNAYIVGETASTDLETKSPALSPLRASFQGGATDGFVGKVDTEANGAASLTYLTYFGGNLNDQVASVAVDSAQRAYITGTTTSPASSFPLLNAFDSTQSNGEAFVAKLNADGTALFYSSFLGGNNALNDGEEGLGITIDLGGNAYVTGRTRGGAGFPVGAVAPPFSANLQGTAFVAKIQASNSSATPAKLLYSATFGGSGALAKSIALDRKGNVHLAGVTPGSLPTTTGAFQTTFNGGGGDGFVAKIGTSFNNTIGVFRSSTNQFLLRNFNTAGSPNLTVDFGQPGDQPIAGDWTGDGTDDVGVFRPSTGQFLLRQPVVTVVRPCPVCLPIVTTTITTITLNFGQAGDLAVAGDWNGDGIDTAGVFRPSTGQWFLSNGPNTNNTTLTVDFAFFLGQAGDTPLAGDWNGDGVETVGLFRGGVAQFILSNDFQGTVDITQFVFGALGSVALAGDWDGDGVDTIGVFNPNTGVMSLNNSNSTGNGIGDLVFTFGQSGDLPVAGDWDGKPL